MKERELSIKPSFHSELRRLPPDQSRLIWDKLAILLQDPTPDGGQKKKLKSGRDLYRLRVGDWRLFYTFGDGWVKLLGLRKRDERTYNLEGVQAEKPIAPATDEDIDAALAGGAHRPEFHLSSPSPASHSLPRPLDPEWLASIGLPPEHIDLFTFCRTEDDLLAVSAPTGVIERITDALYPRPLEEVEKEPDLVVLEPGRLGREEDGDLIPFLLRLDEEQARIADLQRKGPTLVRGGAGTGKSTIALYRARNLAGQGRSRVLFTTYTTALVKASEQLLDGLLPREQRSRVRVATVDQLVLEHGRRTRKVGDLEKAGESRRILDEVRASFEPSGRGLFEKKLRARALAAIPSDYLLDEVAWIIEGRALADVGAYLDAPRPGRGIPMREGIRRAVWELYEAFRQRCAKRGIERWSAMRQEASVTVADLPASLRYDAVLVDEAQDLSPVALRFMAGLARSPEDLFLVADNRQSLYSRNYTWNDADPRLQFKGRTLLLKRNYRSTAEIDRASASLLVPEEGETWEPTESAHGGPKPVWLNGLTGEQEPRWIARFVRQMSRHLRLGVNSAAVLVPSREIGEHLQKALREQRIVARFQAGRDLDLRSPEVKILTLHSAKGLEFPIVVVAGLYPGTWPNPIDFPDQPEAWAEKARGLRRLLYVGLSRAMRGLMLVVPSDCHFEALTSPDAALWHVENAG